MKRVIAGVLLVTQLSGCTIALGTGYATGTQSQMDVDVSNALCTQRAELAWSGSFGKQFGAFMLGFIIIGFPVAIMWERDVKRDAWQACMKERGHRVVPP